MSSTQQQQHFKEVQEEEEMNQEIPPCQRWEMEMNRQIQESIAAT